MSIRRERPVRERLESLLVQLAEEPAHDLRPDPRIDRSSALACLEAGYASRLIDLEARELKNRGDGFYTIGSAGHEGDAVVGRLLRGTDPCLLHYRSGAFMAARLGKAPGETFVRDTLLSLVASSDDPVAGGRHKVWGSRSLNVPPQTSTIASHLPKAVGWAFAIERMAHLGLPSDAPDDTIVCCSFGDASLNHASATTAFNAAAWAATQHLPMPILFVCEDNGLGISVRTPISWIRSNFEQRHGIDYFPADGLDLAAAWQVAAAAIDSCRATRRPTFLHLRVVRLMGHAGSDVEVNYHGLDDIERAEQRDPLLAGSRYVVERGYATGAELLSTYRALSDRISRVAAEVVTRPKQTTVASIVHPLRWPAWDEIRGLAEAPMDDARRLDVHGSRLPEQDRPRHMAMQLSRALRDLMFQHDEMVVFGEDVAKKGGVYHVTDGLYETYGVGRVYNTLLDETTILGLALGAAQAGMLPVPEIQYLAYLHNAEDQIRSEAASLRFFSGDEWDNPMVIRIAALAYQRGFGGHFHNDNSIAFLRDVPGLVLALPSRADDAVGMLRTCVAAAKAGRAVCAFLEPIALYMTRDLYEEGDRLWSFPYPPPGEAVEIGTPRTYEAERPEVLVVTYGNGVPMALQARRQLQLDERVTVMDLRWIAPMPLDAVVEAARAHRQILVLDECRKTAAGVSETLACALMEDERCSRLRFRRVTAVDTYIPLGAAANLVLPQVADVVTALREMLGLEELAS